MIIKDGHNVWEHHTQTTEKNRGSRGRRTKIRAEDSGKKPGNNREQQNKEKILAK